MYKTGFAILTGKKLNTVLVNNSLYGNRTRLSALRGRRTKPIFEGTKVFKASNFRFSTEFPKEDSNPHNQNQNLRCYHYTIGE